MKRTLRICLAIMLLFLCACDNNSSNNSEMTAAQESNNKLSEMIIQPNERVQLSDDIAITFLGYSVETDYDWNVRMWGFCDSPESVSSGNINVTIKIENVGQSELSLSEGIGNADSDNHIPAFYFIRNELRKEMFGFFYDELGNYIIDETFLQPGGSVYADLVIDSEIPPKDINSSYVWLQSGNTAYKFLIENAPCSIWSDLVN